MQQSFRQATVGDLVLAGGVHLAWVVPQLGSKAVSNQGSLGPATATSSRRRRRHCRRQWTSQGLQTVPSYQQRFIFN